METNRNAEQYLKVLDFHAVVDLIHGNPESITLDDMKTYIRLLLRIGVVRYPKKSDYWSKAGRNENCVALK